MSDEHTNDFKLPAARKAEIKAPAAEGWFGIRSRLDGRWATMFMGPSLDGEGPFEMSGPVRAYFDREDAEREAVQFRETFPQRRFDVAPLPATVPAVCRPPRYNDGEPIAAQLHVTRGAESVWVELRPETLTESRTLMTMLQMIVELAAERIAGAEVSPIQLVTLGPIPAQVVVRNPLASPDQEAA